MHEAKHFLERWRDALADTCLYVSAYALLLVLWILLVAVRNSKITLTGPVTCSKSLAIRMSTCNTQSYFVQWFALSFSRLRICIFIKPSACIQWHKGTYSMCSYFVLVYLFCICCQSTQVYRHKCQVCYKHHSHKVGHKQLKNPKDSNVPR